MIIKTYCSGAGQPNIMKGEHNSNIFCLGFDSRCQRLFSAGNDELVMIHDSQTGETVDVILHNDAIYGLSVDPIDDNVFASACDDGRVCLWDIRGPTREPFVLARYTTAFHAVMYNPFESRLVATANTKEGIALWDVRKPRNVLQQFNSSLLSSQSAMSVRFNKTGTLILALRRRMAPVLYNLKSSYPIVEFDNPGYYNSCTMKSCAFGGDSDQYVLSGSDDFKLYVWKIPDQIYSSSESNPESTIWVENAELVLSGHRYSFFIN
jgi:WD repeat-containing protein 22